MVLALKGEGEGKIRLSLGSHKIRQNIRSREVLAYVKEKYECEPGNVLSAWYRDDVLMFARCTTQKEARLRFDSGFKKVDIRAKAPEHASIRVRGQTVSFSASAAKVLGSCVSVHEYKDILLFLPDADGSIHLTTAGKGRGMKNIHSKELADYIRHKYEADDKSLYAWERDGGIYCSNKRTVKRVPRSLYEKRSFRMSEESITVNILQGSRLMISNLGAAVLQKHLSLYRYDSTLALVNDPKGEFKSIRSSNRSGCDITGKDLVRYIERELDLGDETIMSAKVRGDAVYFSNRPITYLPAFKHFEKVEFGRVCQLNVISVKILKSGSGRFYISKSARDVLREGASLWKNGDVLALVNDENGEFKISPNGNAGNRALGEYMRSEFGVSDNKRFYVRNGNNAVFFSENRLDENAPLSLTDFERIVLNH